MFQLGCRNRLKHGGCYIWQMFRNATVTIPTAGRALPMDWLSSAALQSLHVVAHCWTETHSEETQKKSAHRNTGSGTHLSASEKGGKSQLAVEPKETQPRLIWHQKLKHSLLKHSALTNQFLWCKGNLGYHTLAWIRFYQLQERENRFLDTVFETSHTFIRNLVKFSLEVLLVESKVLVRIEKNQWGVKTNQSGEIKIAGPLSEEHRYVRVAQTWMEKQDGVKSKYPRGTRPSHLTNYFHPSAPLWFQAQCSCVYWQVASLWFIPLVLCSVLLCSTVCFCVLVPQCVCCCALAGSLSFIHSKHHLLPGTQLQVSSKTCMLAANANTQIFNLNRRKVHIFHSNHQLLPIAMLQISISAHVGNIKMLIFGYTIAWLNLIYQKQTQHKLM